MCSSDIFTSINLLNKNAIIYKISSVKYIEILCVLSCLFYLG